LPPANASQCLRLAYFKVLPSNDLSSMSVPLGAVYVRISVRWAPMWLRCWRCLCF